VKGKCNGANERRETAIMNQATNVESGLFAELRK
jgi:hypothetical protein